MKRIVILVGLLALATPAAAQWGSGTRIQPSRPGNDTYSRPGSFTNPYVVTDPYGRRMGTVTESRPASPSAPGGSYTNPYQYRPNPGYKYMR